MGNKKDTALSFFKGTTRYLKYGCYWIITL